MERYFDFKVQTTQPMPKRVGRLVRYERKPVTVEVSMRVDGNQIYLGYGYKTWETHHNEGRFSACPGQAYTIHNSLFPREGDVWTHGDREFVLGKREGFVCYTAPLLENGKQVATVHFEDYYKD